MTKKFVDEAAGGKEISIAKAGTPRARPLPLPAAKKPRKPGGWEGKIWIADDFDAPLPPEILAGFYGEDSGDEKQG